MLNRLIPLRLFFAITIIGFSSLPVEARKVLTFNEVLYEGTANSYDIKLAVIDARIGANDIKQGRVAYFPTMHAQFTSEYLHDLTNGAAQVAVVNNTVLPNNTRYQNALSLSTVYTLYDFGVRSKTLLGAKRHAEATRIAVNQQSRDIKLKLVDLYTQALIAYKALQAKQKSLPIFQELFQTEERFFEAGTVPKDVVSEHAIAAAKCLAEINELKQTLAEQLKDISEYTQVAYDPNDTDLSDFNDEREQVPELRVEDTPEFNYYRLEIEKKKFELQALNRQRLPQIGVYSNYLFYGSNPNDPTRALTDFSQRTVSLGWMATMPIFDGFKYQADRDRKRLELSRLMVERDEKLWQLKQQYERMRVDSALYRVQLNTKAAIISESQCRSGMLERLANEQITDRTKLLQQETDLIDHQLNEDKIHVQQLASLLKMRILVEG